MAERRLRTSFGSLRILGWREEWMEYATQLGLQLASSATPMGGFRKARGRRVYIKGGPLVGHARRRHAYRARWLRRDPPRLAEYINLSWLTERLFQVPLPLAAGALTNGAATDYQFLITAVVPGAEELGTYLAANRPERERVLEELAAEIGRMHALHFVHRDLFPRNLLVGPAELERRVFFLDAWRGGCRVQLRGPAYDLACFFLHAPELLSPDEQRAFFERYLAERRVQGRPAPRRLAHSVARERVRLVRRLERQPHRLHGHAMPDANWALP